MEIVKNFMPRPKPPRLKEQKVTLSIMIAPTIKRLLKEASEATGLSQGEYIERSLGTQFKIDYVTLD